MGTIPAKLRNSSNPSSSHLSSQSIREANSESAPIKQTAYGRWQRSNKTIQDLLSYINSNTDQEGEQNKYERIAIYITGIKERERLYEVVSAVEQNILGEINQNMMRLKSSVSEQLRSRLIKLVHPKLANIWFVWNQLAPAHHLTPTIIHQVIFPQIIATPYTKKLEILFNSTKQLPALPSLISQSSKSGIYFDSDKIIKQAFHTNYPFLLNKQTIQTLFSSIIQNDVMIEDVGHFCHFIQQMIVQTDLKRQQLQNYTERVHFYLSERQDNALNELKQYLQKQNMQSSNHIYHIILEAGRIFLVYGNPHAMQLLFQTVLKISSASSQQLYLQLSQQQLNLYLYTQIYSLFVYTVNQLNLQYKHLQKMSISNIIHLLLRNNQISLLGKLKDIFTTVQKTKNLSRISISKQKQSIKNNKYKFKEIAQQNLDQQGRIQEQYNFEKQLSDYIFSNYCSLQVFLQILTKTEYIRVNHNNQQKCKIIQQSFLQKIIRKFSELKFELIIQNQEEIKMLIRNNFNNSVSYRLIYEKIQQTLQIVRLLYMFGVNQKFACVLVFYCQLEASSQVQKEERRKLLRRQSQIQLMEQQKALQLFKIFISKYYISADRTKKILLNTKSDSPISVDLSKPEAVFQISQYLYEKIFLKSLNSIKDIYQLIFQHMIYFYKYDQAKSILSHQSIMARYSITIQSFQLIILNNIIESIHKSPDLYKILPDLNQQLKLLKSRNSVEVQSARSMVKLVSELNSYGIQLGVQERNKIGIQLMEAIIDKYGDRIQVINFDNIYQEIRAINSDYVLDSDEKLMMTNDLLKFKSKLAGKAYQMGKKNLGNQLIDEISRFNPPWLTSSLISIFKSAPSLKFDKRIYGIAMKSCAKGQDLKYLMQLWKQQEGKQRRKQKGFAQFAQYFQTGRQYIVIDQSFIGNQQRYRNYVAECQFNDEVLHFKKYQLFFVLLGTEPQRAFHYGLSVGLDPVKIDIFLREAMKTSIINCYTCVNYLHKYFYFACKMQRASEKNISKFLYYCDFKFNQLQLEAILQQQKKQKLKSPTKQFYLKILSACICSYYITEKFIDTYFANNQQRTNIVYDLLFDQQSRKGLLISLRQQPMGRSDIFTLNSICQKVLDVNFMDLCIFNLSNISNTSQNLQEKSENIMQKIVTLSSGNRKQCEQIVSKLVQKVFSIKKLIQILRYLMSRENPIYKEIIRQKNLEIIENLSLIQIGQELHGLVPSTFFSQNIRFDPVWPMTSNHEKILKRCWAKTNIFVLSKVMYFIYGMNPEIQTKIWQGYLAQHPEEEQLRQIKLQLDKLKKYQIQ